MRHLLAGLTALALAGASAAAAQDADMPLRLEQGAQYTIILEQEQSGAVGGERFAANVSAVTALDIVSTAPGDARWRYTPVAYTINSMTAPGMERQNAPEDLALASEAASALMRLVADVGFECRVDAVGRCVELANWPLWRDRLENGVLFVDAVARIGARVGARAPAPNPAAPASPKEQARRAAAAAEAAEDPSAWTRYREPILQGFAGVIDGVDARAAASLMASFHPPAAVQGRSLRRGQQVDFTEDWPMPFGASPVRLAGALRLERVDRRAGTATVRRTARLDGASAQAALRAMTTYLVGAVIEPFAPLMAREGQGAPSAEMIRGMVEGALSTLTAELDETTVGTVDLATGLARETVTDMRMRLTVQSNGRPQTIFDANFRTTVRITPGAPPTPRLPRAPRT